MQRRGAWLVGAWLGGCPAAQPARVPDPARTTQRFAAALRADRPDAADALLDPELHSAIDRQPLLPLWHENRGELAALGERMQRTPGPAAARAELVLDDGE